MKLGRRTFLTRVAAGILGTSAVQIGRGASAVSAWTGRDTNSVLNQARPADKNELKIATVEPYIMRFGRDGKGRPRGQFYLMCRVETSRRGRRMGRRHELSEGGDDRDRDRDGPTARHRAKRVEHREDLVHHLSRAERHARQRGAVGDFRHRHRPLGHRRTEARRAGATGCSGGKINDKLKIYTERTSGATFPGPPTPTPRGPKSWSPKARWRANGIRSSTIRTKSISSAPTTTCRARPRSRPFTKSPRWSAAIREGGPDFEICVEAHAKFNVGSAVRIAKAIEPYAPMFFEEPVPPENVDAMLEVQRATSVPIAAGERLKSRLEARDYIEREAIRLYQPDAARIGGITEFRKACAMAENHFIPVAPHNPNGPSAWRRTCKPAARWRTSSSSSRATPIRSCVAKCSGNGKTAGRTSLCRTDPASACG